MALTDMSYSPAEAMQLHRPAADPAHGPGLGQVARSVPVLPKNPSLLFDLELEEHATGPGPAEAANSITSTADLARWLLPGSSGEYKLRLDVEAAWERKPDGLGSPLEINQWLAKQLKLLGYQHVVVRTALGGGDGMDCLRNLRHVFLTVSPPGAHATTAKFIVDTLFKASFTVAKPTPRYASLLACLPEVYVAPENSLAPLVNFLCAEMAASFAVNNSVLPPWRQPSAMMSKWLPRKSSIVEGDSEEGAAPPVGMPVRVVGQAACARKSLDLRHLAQQQALGRGAPPAFWGRASPATTARPSTHTLTSTEVGALYSDGEADMHIAVGVEPSSHTAMALQSKTACGPWPVVVGFSNCS
jgi:uncharacterized protein (TIGR01615 family)